MKGLHFRVLARICFELFCLSRWLSVVFATALAKCIAQLPEPEGPRVKDPSSNH